MKKEKLFNVNELIENILHRLIIYKYYKIGSLEKIEDEVLHLIENIGKQKKIVNYISIFKENRNSYNIVEREFLFYQLLKEYNLTN